LQAGSAFDISEIAPVPVASQIEPPGSAAGLLSAGRPRSQSTPRETDAACSVPVPRVCVASSGLGHVSRGIETWAADLGRALSHRGVDVSLCKGGGSETESYEKRLWCLPRESRAARRLVRFTPRRFLWRFGFGSGYEIEQVSFAMGLIRHVRRTRA